MPIPANRNVISQNWDNYRYFLAVARASSIAGAAKLLSESPPTIGRRIRELETQLSAQLFERGAAGVRLTAAGERILQNIQHIEREAFTLNELVVGNDDLLEGRVGLAAPEGFGLSILSPRIAEFNQRYPQIEIELLLGTNKLNILDRAADIAVRIGDPKQSSLVGRRAGTVDFFLYASPSYLQQNGAPQTGRDLDDHCIISSSRDLSKSVQSRMMRELVPHAKRIFRSDSMIAQADAIKSGIGIGALPEYLVQPDWNLTKVLPEYFRCSADLWVLTHPDIKDVARVRSLFDFVLDVSIQTQCKSARMPLPATG